MNCAEAERSMPELLTDGLDAAARSAFQAHLEACPACRTEAAHLAELWARLDLLPVEHPSPALRAGFYRMLEAAQAPTRPQSHWPWRAMAQVAALLLLTVGGFLGGYLLRGPSPTPRGRDFSLMTQSRAELRMAGVMLASQGDPEDAAPAGALLALLDSDPSEAVRLAAVDALYLYGHQPMVRQRLASSLARQTSPRVQLALVDLLGGLREQRALEALRTLMRAPGTTPEVASRVKARLAERPL